MAGTRRQYANFACTLVPQLPTSYLSKVKCGSIRRKKQVVAELHARGICMVDGNGEPLAFQDLRQLLPADADEYLVGGLLGDADMEFDVDELEDVELDDEENEGGEGGATFSQRLRDFFWV